MAGVNWRLALEVIGVIVAAIVMLVVGLGGASIAGGIVEYILGTFNSTNITIPSSFNFLKAAVGSLGTASNLAGIILIIVAAVAIIVLLIMAFIQFFQGGGRQILGGT